MPQDYQDLQELHEVPEALPASRWLPYFSTGLIIGLGVALVVFLRTYTSSQPVLRFEAPLAECPAPVQTPPAESTTDTATETDFEFYTVLPQMEVRVEDWDLEEAMAGSRPMPPGAYYLQSGSYRHLDAASQLREQLHTIGIDTHVQEVDLGENGTWYRVRAGPYQVLEELNRARSLLNRNRIPFILLRDSDAAAESE